MKKDDHVLFKIEQDKKTAQYTISVIVSRDNLLSEIPATIFPSFSTIMYAYIFCVGMIHTAYSQEQIMFISENEAIHEELCRIQSNDESTVESYAKEACMLANEKRGGFSEHRNRTQQNRR